ncbi:hypothetical protein EWI07_01225 [Sporolactobacillus sp. THM7-4]|nr:hypothetical protein EWI07_01225 [Sporolactobacillus sp. THM7-4]
MRRFWAIFVVILCFLIITGGNFYWNHKVSRAQVTGVQKVSDTQQDGGFEQSVSSGKSIRDHIARLPKPVQKAANRALRTSGQVQVVMVGSENVQGLAIRLQNQLDKTFGEMFFKVTANDLGKETSLDLNQAKIQDLFQKVNGKPDVIIYTPLLYNDDHRVSTDDTNSVISLFEEKISLKYPDAAFFVSPPDYSSQEDYINQRIDDLIHYTDKQGITELDYLSRWPKGKERIQVVGADGYTMNQAGQKIWTDYISKKWGLAK